MNKIKVFTLFLTATTLATFAQEVITTTDTNTGVNTQVPVWLLGVVAFSYNAFMSMLQKFVYGMSPGVFQTIFKKLIDVLSANVEHKK